LDLICLTVLLEPFASQEAHSERICGRRLVGKSLCRLKILPSWSVFWNNRLVPAFSIARSLHVYYQGMRYINH
jgi:hypothetical protein